MTPDNTHFAKRCRERGLGGVDTNALWHDLLRAIEAGHLDLAHRSHKGRYWRFFANGGTFYAVTGLDDCRPRTVITQDMLRNKKWAHKQRKRGKSRGEP
jgi:hypothetical protein